MCGGPGSARGPRGEAATSAARARSVPPGARGSDGADPGGSRPRTQRLGPPSWVSGTLDPGESEGDRDRTVAPGRPGRPAGTPARAGGPPTPRGPGAGTRQRNGEGAAAARRGEQGRGSRAAGAGTARTGEQRAPGRLPGRGGGEGTRPGRCALTRALARRHTQAALPPPATPAPQPPTSHLRSRRPGPGAGANGLAGGGAEQPQRPLPLLRAGASDPRPRRHPPAHARGRSGPAIRSGFWEGRGELRARGGKRRGGLGGEGGAARAEEGLGRRAGFQPSWRAARISAALRAGTQGRPSPRPAGPCAAETNPRGH